MSSTRAGRGDGVVVFVASTAPRAARTPSHARRTQEEKAVKKEEKKDSKDSKDKSKKDDKGSSKDSGKDAKKDDKKSDKKVNSEKDAKAKVLTGAVEP